MTSTADRIVIRSRQPGELIRVEEEPPPPAPGVMEPAMPVEPAPSFDEPSEAAPEDPATL